jgi:uncharacterized protein
MNGEISLFVTTVLMVITTLLAFVPILPGPVLPWAVAMVFGALDTFQRFTLPAAILATFVMGVGSTVDLWMPLFGIRTRNSSCQSTLGAMVGGLLGTFFIPIPVIGTLVGMVGGALLVELLRLRELNSALRAGREAFKNYLVSYSVQLITSFTILFIYIVSLLTTG